MERDAIKQKIIDSGGSVLGFCRAHEIDYYQLLQWLRGRTGYLNPRIAADLQELIGIDAAIILGIPGYKLIRDEAIVTCDCDR